MSAATCPVCTYPVGGATCANPGCPANPAVPVAVKERWGADAARAAAAKAERERIASAARHAAAYRARREAQEAADAP